MFGVTCTCSWLELFVVIWSWVKNDAAPFLGVGGLVGGYVVADPAKGIVKYTPEEFFKQWTGILIGSAKESL